MTKEEALKLALNALEPDAYLAEWYIEKHIIPTAVNAIKAALEAKDEPVNDELRRLHDLLGKANALARIRAAEIESMKASLYGLYELEKQRDEFEQRLTKTEAQLGEAVWNYGELKREQLANQQNTSGSPIFSELHCICGAEWEWRNRDWELVATPPQQEAKDEPFEYWNAVEGWVKIDEVRDHFDSVGCGTIYKTSGEDRVPLYTTPPQRTWVGLTDEEANELWESTDSDWELMKRTEAKLKEKNL